MFDSKEEQDTFIRHLKFLLSLTRRVRTKRYDYKTMKETLKKTLHWKDLPRGRPPGFKTR